MEYKYSLNHSFKTRTGPTGRPGPGTGPGRGKNPLGNWPGKTRSTRSNPGETRSIFFLPLPLPLLFLRPPHPGLLHLLPKEQTWVEFPSSEAKPRISQWTEILSSDLIFEGKRRNANCTVSHKTQACLLEFEYLDLVQYPENVFSFPSDSKEPRGLIELF